MVDDTDDDDDDDDQALGLQLRIPKKGACTNSSDSDVRPEEL